MALILLRAPIIFTVSSFDCSAGNKMQITSLTEMMLLFSSSKCLMFCKQMIVWFFAPVIVLRSVYSYCPQYSTPMGKLSYDDKLRIQTPQEQVLVQKPSFSSYPDKGWKLSSIKKVCSQCTETVQDSVQVAIDH